MARMPVNGVRTSCAKAASAASTMPGAAVAAARFATLALAAVALEARFFGDRRFGGGAVRLVRGLDAMIPPTRPGQHAMACHRESR